MTVLSNGILAVMLPLEKYEPVKLEFPDGHFDLRWGHPTMDRSENIYLVWKFRGGSTILCTIGQLKDYPHDFDVVGIHSAGKPLSEEQCGQLIDDCHFAYPDFTVEALNGDNIRLKSASESLESWMRANKVFTVNPYGIDPYGMVAPECGETCSCVVGCYQAQNYRDADKRTGNWVFLKQIEV